MRFSKKALAVLTGDERMALNLKIIGGKSTWDAGEIIRRSHYKYLEIEQRAKRFVEIFTAYFNNFDEFIPDELNVHPGIKLFLTDAILNRKRVRDAANQPDYPSIMVPQMRLRYLKLELEKLKQSKSIQAVSLYELIIEFDRYNNFRILPLELQYPSGFKRRHKNLHKKHINRVVSMSKSDIEYIEKAYGLDHLKSSSIMGESNTYYTFLITDADAQLYKIIKVSRKPHVVEYFTKRYLYLFRVMEDAGNLCKAIINFHNLDNKHCRDGQNFWPLYRELISKAVNYKDITKRPFDKSLTFAEDPIREKKAAERGKEFFIK